MLITTIEELEAIYPTSRWDRIEKLLPLFSKVERTRLSRYLGMPLLKTLNEQYNELCEEEGGITAIHIDDYAAHSPQGTVHGADAGYPTGEEEGEEPTMYTQLPLVLDILRSCQEVIVYITLSNNVRILTSSLNQGGGFNTMTTDDYDQSGDTQLKALSQELWRNAMDSLDSLLILLEQDAQGCKLYTEEWKQSQYYYMHSDLIFRTAEELSHYVPLEGGRASFIQLTPGLRNAQNQYIETRIGSDLLQHLIADTASEKAPADLWRAFSRHIRQALANYANIEMLRLKGSTDKNSTQSRARSEMQNDYHEYGDREMSLALDVIISNPQEFQSVITANPILQYEYQRKQSHTWQQYLDSLTPSEEESAPGTVHSASCQCSSSPRKKRNGVCDLGGWHTM